MCVRKKKNTHSDGIVPFSFLATEEPAEMGCLSLSCCVLPYGDSSSRVCVMPMLCFTETDCTTRLLFVSFVVRQSCVPGTLVYLVCSVTH